MGEGDCGLGDDTELSLPLDEQRGDDQGRNDLDHVVVAGGKESEVAVHQDDALEIRRQILETLEQLIFQPGLASQERDGVGVLADMDQARAKVRFLVELVVV